MSYKKDNYTEIYQELINEGFFDSIGNGVIGGVKGIGKGISKVWKWNKKRQTNNEINTNIQQLIENAITTRQNIEINLINLKNILNNWKELTIDTLNKESINNSINEINNSLNNSKTLLLNTINTLDTSLPASPFKPFFNKMKNLGNTICTMIIDQKIIDKNNIVNIINQTFNAATIELKNNYLKTTLATENSKSYLQVYLDLLNEDKIFSKNISIITEEYNDEINAVKECLGLSQTANISTFYKTLQEKFKLTDAEIKTMQNNGIDGAGWRIPDKTGWLVLTGGTLDKKKDKKLIEYRQDTFKEVFKKYGNTIGEIKTELHKIRNSENTSTEKDENNKDNLTINPDNQEQSNFIVNPDDTSNVNVSIGTNNSINNPEVSTPENTNTNTEIQNANTDQNNDKKLQFINSLQKKATILFVYISIMTGEFFVIINKLINNDSIINKICKSMKKDTVNNISQFKFTEDMIKQICCTYFNTGCLELWKNLNEIPSKEK